MNPIKPLIVSLALSLGLTLATAGSASAERVFFVSDSSRGASDYDVVGGLGLSIGGGVSTFTESRQRDFLGTAGTWDARVTLGTRSPVALEAAYTGSAQSIDRLGLSSDAMLFSNGAEADLRINLFPGPVTPFLLGGVGWRHYSIENSAHNTSDVLDSDNVFEVPLGVGASVRVGHFLIDGRAVYRAAFDDDLVRSGDVSSSSNRDLHTIGARLGLGVEF